MEEIITVILVLLLLSGVLLFVYFLTKPKACKEFYDSGELKRKYFQKKKKNLPVKHKKETLFYRDGKINKTQYWENGELNGSCTVFYATGEKYIKSNYLKGKLDGDYDIFSKDGEIIKSYVYKDGVKISESEGSMPVAKIDNIDLIREEETKSPKQNQIVEKDEDVSVTNSGAGDILSAFKFALSKSSQVKLAEVPETELIDDYQIVESFEYVKQSYDSVRTEESNKAFDKEYSNDFMKILKTVTGIQGIQDRKSGKNLKESCSSYYQSANDVTEAMRIKLNDNINSFGQHRLKASRKTIGKFLGFLKDMQQENKTKEYEILDGIGLDTKTIEKMESVDMAASKALASTATVGALGAAAAMGTPTLVTGAVSAFANASTGIAIHSLSGAAATNATLAWLGGGAIKVGGGGMAAGAATLSAMTMTATAGVGLIAAGLIASTHYAKKLTEAKEYQKEVEIAVANMEKMWVLMDGINKRANELDSITSEMEQRIVFQLDFMEPLTVDYDTSHEYYNSVFQKTGLLIKAMGELSQTPLLDEEGNTSTESANIIAKTHTILNKELINNA